MKLLYKFIPFLSKFLIQDASWITDTILFRLLPFAFITNLKNDIPMYVLWSFCIYRFDVIFRAMFWFPWYPKSNEIFKGLVNLINF